MKWLPQIINGLSTPQLISNRKNTMAFSITFIVLGLRLNREIMTVVNYLKHQSVARGGPCPQHERTLTLERPKLFLHSAATRIRSATTKFLGMPVQMSTSLRRRNHPLH